MNSPVPMQAEELEALFADDEAPEILSDDDGAANAPWLLTLVGEAQALLSVARRRRELVLGEPATRPEFLRLSDAALDALAAGRRILAGQGTRRREWTLATVASSAELTLGQWRRLLAATRRIRRSRSDAQALAYAAAERQLPPRLADIIAILAVLTASPRLFPLLERCGWGDLRSSRLHTPGFLLLASRISDQAEEIDREGWFGRGGLLQRSGICAPASDADEVITHTPIHLAPAFCARCLGLQAAELPPTAGGQPKEPTERLADVVLSADQRRQAESVLLALPWVSGTAHALGVLLHGPSGTGKTMLARALAGSSGRPLLVVAPREDKPQAGLHAPDLEAYLERSAREHLVLLIDEADGLLNAELSRCLLTALERCPAALILATNHPERLEKALDRRLQIKIAMGSPGPRERCLLLRRELRVQAPPLAAGLLADPELDRLAESACLPGGYWRTVVEEAACRARAMAPTGPAPLTLDLLAAGVVALAQTQIASFGLEAPALQWDHAAAPAEPICGPQRQAELDACAEALARLRAERSGQGDPGLGCVVGLSGPEETLARAVAMQLARHLRLPLGCLGADVFERDGKAGAKRERGEEESEAVPDPTPAAQQVLSALGEQSVMLITVRTRRQWLAARPLVGQLAASRHLGILHVVAGDLLDPIRRHCVVLRPWAQPDAWSCQRLWEQLGCAGPAPGMSSFAALRAAALRRRLAALGLPGGAPAHLP